VGISIIVLLWPGDSYSRFCKWVFFSSLFGFFFFLSVIIKMGNVNGREDGSGSPSGGEEGGVEEGGGGGGLEEGMAAPGGAHGVSPPDLMGQSPPHSPRATQSPLMFTPQVSSFSLSPTLFFSVIFFFKCMSLIVINLGR